MQIKGTMLSGSRRLILSSRTHTLVCLIIVYKLQQSQLLAHSPAFHPRADHMLSNEYIRAYVYMQTYTNIFKLIRHIQTDITAHNDAQAYTWGRREQRRAPALSSQGGPREKILSIAGQFQIFFSHLHRNFIFPVKFLMTFVSFLVIYTKVKKIPNYLFYM